ncbi:MAG TPA: ABC transporter permease [Nitrospirales bacterium]|nr:ABC transporter permease [Nitrospirales bacterium]
MQTSDTLGPRGDRPGLGPVGDRPGLGPVGWIGARVLGLVQYAAELNALGAAAVRDYLHSSTKARRETRRVISRQILFTGVDALPVISVIALLLGIIVISQAATQLPKVGAGQLLGNIVVVVLIRELGPLLTAFVIVARSGTAITTELGNMRVGQEVTALELMGIPISQYLVLTRVAGVVLSMVSLTLYFDLVAVFGGFLVAKVNLTLPFSAFVESVITSLGPMDILSTVIKSVLFGLTVAIICCHHGLSVRSSYTEVPQQTTKAMINSVTICLFIDIVITFAAYL